MVQRKSLFIGGLVTVTLATGEGSQAVVFDTDGALTFRTTPIVLCTINDTDHGPTENSTVWVESITPLGFTVFVEGTIAAGTIDVGWIAFERLPAQQ